MTGNKINHVYNGKYDWVDELDRRGDSKKDDKRRKIYARRAKRRERIAARRIINKELADI